MFLTLAQGLARARERSATIASAVADDAIVEKLELSKGMQGAIAHYRPYWVAAKLIEQDPARQTLTEADGVKFTNQLGIIDSLMAEQFAYDSRFDLAIPPGYQVPIDQVSDRVAAGLQRRGMRQSINQLI